MLRYLSILLLAFCVAGCDLTIPGADEKFGRQNFVSAISIIELHHTRYGEYPRSLKDLKFLGDWDAIWLASVRYEKVDDGYNLYVERGWMGKPDLEFAEEFKTGLGIRDSNVKWLEDGKPDEGS
ncbi:hypothetical protein BTA51_13390 [Hahella sp. CCB-MM4]|nr:hypothetical protein BTA51_13390 [Hahella sp. CCB-MM4]